MKAFLALILCSIFGGVLAGMAVGAIYGAVMAVSGFTSQTHMALVVLGGVSGLAVTYFFFRLLVLRLIVRKLSSR